MYLYTGALCELFLSPRGREIEIGLTLHALTAEDLESLGCTSLTQLLNEQILTASDAPDYSTVMRWVRAASVLDGPDDPRRAWGLSKLVEVERLSTSQREEFLRKHDPATMTVRQLTAAVRDVTSASRVSPEIDEPHSVLERAIHAYLDRQGISREGIELQLSRKRSGDQGHTLTLSSQTMDQDAAAVMAGASRVMEAIARAKAAWRRESDYTPPEVPEPMRLEEIDALPAGQLEAEWESPDVACIRKSGQPIAWLPVRRLVPDRVRLVKPPAKSNVKLMGVFGLIDSISQGCMRRATGWPDCHEPCFTIDAADRSGCYVTHGKWQSLPTQQKANYDIGSNGLTNDLMTIRLPVNGSPSLSRRRGDLWRVDAETADGAMSVALGLFQGWAEANPDKRFTTICSHHFRPPDEMLAWLSSLRNVWVGHTIASSFHEEELRVRFGAIERFLSWGIPTVIWIVTHEDWDNISVLERALQLVTAEQIIEAPYRYGTESQDLPLLGVNPLGSCSDHRIDGGGIEYHIEWQPDPASGRPVARLVDEFGHGPPTRRHSKCVGCELLCGANVLGDRMR